MRTCVRRYEVPTEGEDTAQPSPLDAVLGRVVAQDRMIAPRAPPLTDEEVSRTPPTHALCGRTLDWVDLAFSNRFRGCFVLVLILQCCFESTTTV